MVSVFKSKTNNLTRETGAPEEDAEMHPVTSQLRVDSLGLQSVLSNQDIVLNIDHQIGSDEAQILALGYKQEFKREFSLLSIFSVSFSVLGLLPSVAATFEYQQLVIGASPVPWIIAIIGVTCVAYSMAEVASAFPTSAGTPYAVSQLAPKKWAPLLTYICCLSNWMCQITAAPSANYAGASMILALASFTKGVKVTNGRTYAVCTAIQLVHGLLSSMPTKYLAKFNLVSTSLNLIFLAVVFVVIFAANNREAIYNHTIPKFNSNSEAWGFTNLSDFPQGVATIVSFLGVIWTMSGYDSPFHLAEECANAAVAAPKAIVLTSTSGGLIGFFFMVAIAYTVVSIKEIANDPLGLGQPFVTYLTQIVSKQWVLACISMTIVASFLMGCSCMLAASRVTFSYSRDGLFPGSKWWKIVNPITQTPVNAVWINLFLGQLFLLLIFAGDTAIGAIFSVGGISSQISFVMPTFLKITYARKTFVPGPWSLGWMSLPMALGTIGFVGMMIPFLCFPTNLGKNLTPNNMNWTVVVFFGPMLMFMIWWVVDAHKWYIGPRPNIDEYILEPADDGFEVLNGINGSENTSSEKEKN